MQSRIVLAVAGFAASAIAAAVPASSPVVDATNVTFTVYPDGLPAELIPTEASSGSVEKRANAGVYLCTDSYFNGYCVHIVQPQFQCSK